MIKMTADGGTLKAVLEWIPSFGINFTAYVDGLGLLFALLITGIGSLVVLYSIYYLSKEREQLGPFYVYLLMFMGQCSALFSLITSLYFICFGN